MTACKITFEDVRAQKGPTYSFFLNLPRRKVMIYSAKKAKNKWGVTDFVLERTFPKEHPKPENIVLL